MKFKEKLLLIIIVGLLVIQMIFVWGVDVSTGAWKRDNILTNGFGIYDPCQIYHICIFGIIGITFIFVIILLFYRDKNILLQKIQKKN